MFNNNYGQDNGYGQGNDYSYYEEIEQPQTSGTGSPSSGSRSNGSGGSRSNGSGSRRKGSFGGAIVKALCCGLIFGLAASGVIFGFNRAGLFGGSSSPAALTSSAGGTVNIVQTSSTGAETTDSDDVSEIVEAAMPGIVSVNTTVESTITDWFGHQYTEESQGAGSGIIISESDGILYLITNYHVVKGAKTVSVQFVDQTNATATVKGYDEDGDIAVLMVNMSDLSEETKSNIAISVMGNSDDLKAGQSAIAIGNALGYGQSVTTGVISAAARDVELTDKTMTLIQTSAAINPGNSGGALLNGKGEVIGINTVKFSDTSVEGMGYAIPINTAIEIAKGIIDGSIVTKTDENTAYLGITGGTLDENTAKAYDAPAGVYVSSVARGSAAERAGLAAGCIITGFNGEDISTMEALQEAIAECAPGDNVTITAQFPARDGEYTEQELTTIMGAKSDAE